MGCATCGRTSVTTYAPIIKKGYSKIDPPVVIVENCDYTIAQLNIWLQKLICCKDTGLYVAIGLKPNILNKYLGIVMSAINYYTNPCHFKKDLDVIGNVIISIENTGKC